MSKWVNHLPVICWVWDLECGTTKPLRKYVVEVVMYENRQYYSHSGISWTNAEPVKCKDLYNE